jgi:hypothetical protein
MREQIRTTMRRLGILLVALSAWSGVASAQSWLNVPTPPRAFNAGNALQLTDGTIMVQEYGTSNWWKLTPDEHADYNHGTWSQLASATTPALPEDYAPFEFAAAVLKDGRVIVEGGEYTFSKGVRKKTFTNQGAIYDPVLNSWEPVPAPCRMDSKGKCEPNTEWKIIGDGPSIVLPDGTFMLGAVYSTKVALLDVPTMTWTIVSPKGKFDKNYEEGWTLLPPIPKVNGLPNPEDGNVLTVDAYLGAPAMGSKDYLENNSEIYDPATKEWTSAGDTKKPLTNTLITCDGVTGGHEVGPAVLRPDGTVFATGAGTCGAGHTAIYLPSAGTMGLWTAKGDIPSGNNMTDAPAAVLQDGNVLVLTSPGKHPPSTFYEFDLKTNKFLPTPIPPPPGFRAGSSTSEDGRMLVVSSGHVLFIHNGSPSEEMGFYVPQGTYEPLWTPFVNSIGVPISSDKKYTIYRGGPYIVSGTQLNGLSQGAYFGDENQAATNYPLVQIENCQTGHKFFARTYNFSTMGVATGPLTIVSATYMVTPNIELGPSTLTVIANGIPSPPFEGLCVVDVQGSPPLGN